jgi:16S rRNA (cytidine1402-2'-O)-methyltransferase
MARVEGSSPFSRSISYKESLVSNPKLYLVSTPIGNLSDLSEHAKNVLSSVSFILCEDTRHTYKLLNHFQIKNHLESLHVHNEKNKIDYLIEKINQSPTQSAALVSDAGTPAICDPGSYLVEAAHKNNIQIIIVAGPSSMPSAIAASGFIQPRTIFSGFLSKNKLEQFSEFKIWKQASPCIAVFFESPKRLLDTLKNLQKFVESEIHEDEVHKIEVCISKEISKKFEEHRRHYLTNTIEYLESLNEIQGEFVVCINLNKVNEKNNKPTIEEAALEAALYSKIHKTQLKASCKIVAEKYEYNAKEIYSAAILGNVDVLSFPPPISRG